MWSRIVGWLAQCIGLWSWNLQICIHTAELICFMAYETVIIMRIGMSLVLATDMSACFSSPAIEQD